MVRDAGLVVGEGWFCIPHLVAIIGFSRGYWLIGEWGWELLYQTIGAKKLQFIIKKQTAYLSSKSLPIYQYYKQFCLNDAIKQEDNNYES